MKIPDARLKFLSGMFAQWSAIDDGREPPKKPNAADRAEGRRIAEAVREASTAQTLFPSSMMFRRG